MAAYNDDVQLTVGLEPGNVVNTAKHLSDEIGRIFSKTAGADDLPASFKNLQIQMDKALTKSQQIQDAMTTLANQRFVSDDYKQLNTEYDQLLNKLKELQELYRAARTKQINNLGLSTTDINTLNEYNTILQQAADLQDRIREKEQSGTDTYSGTQTDKYRELAAQLNNVNNQMVVLRQRANEATDKLRDSGDEADNSSAKLNGIGNQLRSLVSAALFAGNGIKSAIASAGSAVGSFLSKQQGFVTFRSLLSKLLPSFKQVATYAARAAANLGKIASRSIISGLKKLAGALTSVHRSGRSSNNIFASGFKTLLRYGLGVRSVYFLVRKLRQALIEGIGELAKAHEPLNAAVSEIMTSLTYLRNSFASAFAPIIETVAPILSQFINMIAEAVQQVGMLIAALTGKEFVRAVPVYKDYAESLDKASDSSKKATKATEKQQEAEEELQRTLASFDDVQILKENKNKDSNTTDPTELDAATTTPAFTTSSIGASIKDFAKKILDAWKNADFTSIGRIVGEKIRDALNRIPWDKIKSVLRRIAKSIATFLNGFLETPGLFDAIGRTIAEAINSAFEFVSAFVRNFHWDSLGAAIRDLILSTLQNLDWSLIFETLKSLGAGLAQTLQEAFNNPEVWEEIFNFWKNAILALLAGIKEFLAGVNWKDLGTNIGSGFNKAFNNPEIWTELFTTLAEIINSLVDFLNGLITSIDWLSLGQNIAIGLNNGIQAINWNNLAQLLTNGINAILDLAYGFLTTFDFANFGYTIGNSLAQVIRNVNWEEFGADFGLAVTNLWTTIKNFLDGMDWKALGKGIVTAGMAYFENLDFGEYTGTISSAAKALLDFMSGQFEGINWSELPDLIMSKIKEGIEGFDYASVAESAGRLLGDAFKAITELGSALMNKMLEFGKAVMEGGFQGIKDALVGVAEWIKTNIVDPFIEGFKSAFQIGSPSKVMEPYGQYIIDGLLQGIKNLMGAIEGWIKTNIVDPFVDGVTKLFGLNGEESVLVSVGKDLIAGLKIGIGSVMSGITTWIKDVVVDPFVKGVKDLFGLNGGESVLVSVGKDLISGLKTGISDTVNNMGSWMKEHVSDPICGLFESLFEIGSPSKVFKRYGGFMMEGLEGGIDDNVKLPKDAVSNAQDSMLSIFSSFIKWTNAGGSIMSLGLAVGIALQSKKAEDAITTVHDTMLKIITDAVDSWKNAGENLIINLKYGIDNHQHDVVQTISNMTESMTSSIRECVTTFSTAGHEIVSSLANGLADGGWDVINEASNIANGISDAFNQDWGTIGYNIGIGIYNGLISTNGELEVLAWNTAVNMYNSACRALGIASPSKKFAWIGTMMTEGWGNGIEDNKDFVSDAVSNVVDTVEDEASNANAMIDLNTDVGDTLTSFSDTIVSEFEKLITNLQTLANFTMANVPAVVSGKVVPYASGTTQDRYDSATEELLNELDYINAHQISIEEIEQVLDTLLRRHMNWSFYLGDEQVARHANAGNLKLEKRYGV